MCVLPERQRHGIGSKLMEYGLEQMNTRDLEGFVEASAAGRPLYSRFGFLDIAYVAVNMEHDDLPKTDAWRELERTRLPIDYTVMWRPRGGSLSAAEVNAVWQERLKAPLRNYVKPLI